MDIPQESFVSNNTLISEPVIKKKYNYLRLIILLMLLIGVGFLAYTSFNIIGSKGIATYKNSKYGFKFSYNRSELSENHIWSEPSCTGDKTCGHFKESDDTGTLIGYSVEKTEKGLGFHQVDGYVPMTNNTVYIATTFTYEINDNSQVIQKQDMQYSPNPMLTLEAQAVYDGVKNHTYEEKILEPIFVNDYGVPFYKIYVSGHSSYCTIKSNKKYSVCFHFYNEQKSLDPALESILDTFTFYKPLF